jgi:hypothetical protein
MACQRVFISYHCQDAWAFQKCFRNIEAYVKAKHRNITGWVNNTKIALLVFERKVSKEGNQSID